MTSIWWIRRDLRLTDNPALHSALDAGDVIPVFILDPSFSVQSPRRRSFLYEGLSSLNKNLQTRGSYLVIRTGKPVDVLRQLIQETNATAIFAEEDYTPYARKRDSQIASQLPVQLILGQTVHHPEFVKKADGKPYTIYTPYSKIWKSLLQEIKLIPAPKNINTPAGIQSDIIPAFETNPFFPAGEAEALKRLKDFTSKRIFAYDEARNRMDLDGTSSLSPYLRFGMLGLRQAVSAARQASAESRGAEVWLNELIWREFYLQVLHNFPHVTKGAFRPEYDALEWSNNEDHFQAWCAGMTGYPIVDAAMRCLNQTGNMHNRLRMIVAMFLTKDLLISWQRGERYFMKQLVDGDMAANNGGWQWSAGTGTDAAPYFRIFNPVAQGLKFDPQGEFVRRWVPELAAWPAEWIHEPWKDPLAMSATRYPGRVVKHEVQRVKCLAVYRKAKQSTSAA